MPSAVTEAAKWAEQSLPTKSSVVLGSSSSPNIQGF